MSGPKVVRIVTREEILETCHGQLARVDAAIDEWLRVGKRNGCIDDAAIAAVQQRRDHLAGLIAADRFIDFQKQAPIEEAFIRDDLRCRLAKVTEEQAAARSKERREKQAASAVLKALRAAGTEMEAKLESGLERGDPDATARGLLLLRPKAETRADAALAARLNDGAPVQSFAEWTKAQSGGPDDPAIARIELRIAEIAQFGPVDQEEEWREKIAEAQSVDGARRDLILDHLEVQTGQELTMLRKRSAALSDFTLTIAEARAAGLETTVWAEGLDALAPAELDRRRTELAEAIEAARSERAVAARRLAVLEGLSALGYEVNQGMETLWASEGRLVLKSAVRPDYGVELAGNERLQLRPVAFESGGCGPDPSRDRDAETIWCGDVTTLRESLAKLGGRLEIERAQPIGAVPLKRIERKGGGDGRAAETSTRRTRTLG
jgi:hypothetical protein